MEIPGGIPLRHNRFIQKGFRVKRLRVQLAALQHQARFRKTYIAVLRHVWRQAGGGHLVRIPSARCSAHGQSLMVLMAEKGKRQLVPGLNKTEGMALGADNDKRHGLLPHEPQTAPTGRHHVEMLRRTRRHQHPVAPDQLYGIILNLFWFNLLHHRLQRSFANYSIPLLPYVKAVERPG